MANKKLSHLDSSGKAKMVDVSEKKETMREAIARGKILMNKAAFEAIKAGSLEKGEALSTARLAGILAAKRTAEMIPLCHPLKITSSAVDFFYFDNEQAIEAEARVKVRDVTGAEMEALTSVVIALLTLYDMAKALDKSMTITDVCLVYKSGGQSGVYTRKGVK